MTSRRVTIYCLLFAFLILATGTTAQQPKPLTGGFDPDDVLANLEQRIAERDWKRYGDFLAPDFRFVPHSAVPVEYPNVAWDDWGLKQELRFIRELVSPSHRASLELRAEVLDRGPESQGRAEWDLVYTLTSRGQVFRSRAVFVFVKMDNLWFLQEWIDTTVETEEETESFLATSGTLRGALSR